MNVVRLAVPLGVFALVSACSAAGSTPISDPDGTSKGRPPESQAPAAQPYTISFGGDVHFEGGLRQRLGNPDKGIGPIGKTLGQADLAMVNLETAITTGGTAAPDKEFTFRASPKAFDVLKAAGVDVVSMANNHGMDFMQAGLRDSLKAIKAKGFPVVGIGKDATQAYAPWTTEVKGNRVAVIGATQVLDAHLIQPWTATENQGGLASAKEVPRLVKAVKDARQKADTVIVYLHWGEELNKCPLPRQKSLAKTLAKAGADVIVGGHAHIPLAGGFRKNGKYVHYGLGNFVFSSASGPTANSGVLTLKIQGRKVLEGDWAPARISGGIPRLLKGSAKKQELRRWTSLRSCAGKLSDTP